MITTRIRIDLSALSLGYYYYASERVAEALIQWLPLIVTLPEVSTVAGRFNKTYETGGCSFEIDDKSLVWDSILTNSRYVFGKPVKIYLYSADTKVLEQDYVIENVSKVENRVRFNLSENKTALDTLFPTAIISAVDYPSAPVNAIGKAKPIIYGNVHSETGAVTCWRVSTGKYLIAGHAIKSLDNVYQGTVAVADAEYGLDNNSDGCSYILSLACTDEFVTANVHGIAVTGTMIEDTKTVLAHFIDNYATAIDYDATMMTAFGVVTAARGYTLGFALTEQVPLRTIISNICLCSDAYWWFDRVGKLRVKCNDYATVTAAKSYSESEIISCVESFDFDGAISSLKYSYHLDGSQGRYEKELTYVNAAAVTNIGTKEREIELPFLYSDTVAADVSHRMVEQCKFVPQEVEIEVAKDIYLSLGLQPASRIGVTHRSLMLSGETIYEIIREQYVGNENIVKLTARKAFAQTSVAIVASAGTGGKISPSGLSSVESTGTITYTVTASDGYSISAIKVDGSSVGTGPTYTFTHPTANHTIEAVFTLNTVYYLLGMYVVGAVGGKFDSSGVPTYYALNLLAAASSTYTQTWTADAGYHVVDALVDGVSIGAVTTHTFSSIAANHTLSVEFST